MLIRMCCAVRYMAIIHPLQQRLTSMKTRVVMAIIWMLALLLAFPQYYHSTTMMLPGRSVCFIDWPEYTTVDFKKMWVTFEGAEFHVMLQGSAFLAVCVCRILCQQQKIA